MTIIKSNNEYNFARALDTLERVARKNGATDDQIRNFLRTHVALQPRQWLASAAARLCDRPGGPTEVAYGGARGGGKSFWMFSQMACDDCRRVPYLKCLLLRKVGKSLREAVDDQRRIVLRGYQHTYNRGNGVIQFHNGSRIVLGHYKDEKEVDNYLGLEYDVIGIEEATTLTLAKVRIIRSCNRTNKRNWRPRMYYTTNPGGIGHTWFKSYFIDPFRTGTERYTRFIPATVDDNRFLNREYTRNLDSLTGWQLRAWRHGDWDIAAGQFYGNWRYDLHVLTHFDIHPDWRVWLAMDYGFVHWTIVYLLVQDGDGNIFAVDEWAQRKQLPAVHAAGIAAMLARHGVARHKLWRFVVGADVFSSRENGSIAEQYGGLGFKLSAADTDRINGAAELLVRLGDPGAGIAPTLFIHERCRRLTACLPAMQHDPHRPEDVLKWDADEDGTGGDDAYDALRYGIMAVAGPIPWFRDKATMEWMKNR